MRLLHVDGIGLRGLTGVDQARIFMDWLGKKQKHREEEAFRICRSLAEHESDDSKLGTFFLSCAELAMRLGIPYDTQAQRVMTSLEHVGIIEMIHKGSQRAKGQKALATEWRWRYPLDSTNGSSLEKV